MEVLLPDGDKLWDPTLQRIDAILDDDVLVDRIAAALARRHPQIIARHPRRRYSRQFQIAAVTSPIAANTLIAMLARGA